MNLEKLRRLPEAKTGPPKADFKASTYIVLGASQDYYCPLWLTPQTKAGSV